MPTPFLNSCELAEQNPGGLDALKNPHNFSNNPGFITTGAGVAGGTAMRPVSGARRAPIGMTSRIGINPGSNDSRSDGSPLGYTGGFGA